MTDKQIVDLLLQDNRAMVTHCQFQLRRESIKHGYREWLQARLEVASNVVEAIEKGRSNER